ncbi:MAG TPA: nitrophenyl compound nitroreductase subunit ArsF family protein [Bacteroidales bacterium]|nr:nitrophenyl compound nitroreductase subunit ArsF family protein [Bacteroidales bacterium]
MTKAAILLFSVLLLTPWSGGNAQNKPVVTGKTKVEVYYFHPNERCPIDQSIEENARDLMQKSFGKEIREGTIDFRVFNTDEAANAKIVSRFDINAQALYVVQIVNGKEVKKDLTGFAFQYGLSNPAKFRNGLTDEVTKALK